MFTESKSLGLFQMINSVSLLEALAMFADEVRLFPGLVNFLKKDGLLEWLLSLLSQIRWSCLSDR